MNESTGEIIVTLTNNEKHYDYDRLGVTFDSSDQEIFTALAPILLEEEGFVLSNDIMATKRMTESQNTFVFPKSPAGSR